MRIAIRASSANTLHDAGRFGIAPTSQRHPPGCSPVVPPWPPLPAMPADPPLPPEPPAPPFIGESTLLASSRAASATAASGTPPSGGVTHVPARHAPAPFMHGVPSGLATCAGHTSEAPEQIAACRQSVAASHTVVLGLNVSGGHAAELPV